MSAATSPELDRVFEWRRDQFLRDGFKLRQAVRLAEDGADHHEAERLLRAGCPHEIAYRLLKTNPGSR